MIAWLRRFFAEEPPNDAPAHPDDAALQAFIVSEVHRTRRPVWAERSADGRTVTITYGKPEP